MQAEIINSNLAATLGLWLQAGAESGSPAFGSLGAWAILGLGLVFGLKHATEADHIVAVSTIVSQNRSLLRAALIGGLWGAGHTFSLVVVGALVLLLRVAIPERIAGLLELGVALMIIGLGFNAFVRAQQIKKYQQINPALTQAKVEDLSANAAAARTTAVTSTITANSHFHLSDIFSVGRKPLLVGAMHGLASSAGLTLLVLTQIGSPLLGLLYLAVFGLGSICGMLLMSLLVGLPFALSAAHFQRFNYRLQTVAAVFSVLFGIWYAYQVGSASGLLAAIL